MQKFRGINGKLNGCLISGKSGWRVLAGGLKVQRAGGDQVSIGGWEEVQPIGGGDKHDPQVGWRWAWAA